MFVIVQLLDICNALMLKKVGDDLFCFFVFIAMVQIYCVPMIYSSEGACLEASVLLCTAIVFEM